MNSKTLALAAAVSCALTVAARAETKVALKGVHLCCGQCVSIAEKAVGKIEGAKAACDQDAGTITVTASDDKTAQKALDALAGEGFYGKSDNAKVLIKPAAASKDKVKRLVISGVHNCCGQCAKAIKAVVTKVDGVEAADVKVKATSFVVEGDFAPADLVKALNEAGFQANLDKK